MDKQRLLFIRSELHKLEVRHIKISRTKNPEITVI